MFKIMLADDEGIMIDSLKFLITKEFGDEVEIEYAKTGRNVIELAEAFRPDIAIMDIQMPGINGIEAIRQIKERDPNIIFIIMTAYDKFSYAREAVNLGVFEYLNKPINRSELIRVLREAMDKIGGERRKRERELMIQEKMETVVPIIENGLVYDILFRENYSEDVENFKNILEIRANYGLMAVLVCGEDLKGTKMTNVVGSSVRVQQAYPRLRELLKRYLNGVIGSAMGNKIVLFLPYNKEKMEYQDRIELIRRAQDMISSMQGEHNAIFRLGMGTVCPLDDLQVSYNAALKALGQRDDRVVHADDMPMSVNYEEDYPVEEERAMFASIDRKDLSGVLAGANAFFDWMERCYADDLDDIRLKVLEFVLAAESRVYIQVGGVYRFQSRKNYLSDVLNMNELPALRLWFIGKMTEACQRAQSGQSERSDNAISRARKFIEENYMRTDISLDEVSQEVDISPYYFSKLFKEETGQNFIDYLTAIRIDRAKELLICTNYSMKEIGAEIGYSDPNYFSRTFKKNVGVTPTEYKERGSGI